MSAVQDQEADTTKAVPSTETALDSLGNSSLTSDQHIDKREENSEDEYLSAEDGDDDENDEDDSWASNEVQNELSDRLGSQHLNENHSNDSGCPGDDDGDVVRGVGNEDEDVQSSEQEEASVEDDTTDEARQLELRQKLEESLTEEEKEERKCQSQELKDGGNAKFREGNYGEALEAYTQALDICPLSYHKERSIMYSNRAACKMKKEQYESAIKDSTSAIDLHPTYLKALLRRAELYEKTEKLDEALTDYQKVLELDPGNGMARAACMRLPQQIKDRNEKMKEEMMGKLKELGNLVLRPFGLSTNNFKMQQDPQTGSYSMQFQQNPPGNGT